MLVFFLEKEGMFTAVWFVNKRKAKQIRKHGERIAVKSQPAISLSSLIFMFKFWLIKICIEFS